MQCQHTRSGHGVNFIFVVERGDFNFFGRSDHSRIFAQYIRHNREFYLVESRRFAMRSEIIRICRLFFRMVRIALLERAARANHVPMRENPNIIVVYYRNKNCLIAHGGR